MFKGTVELLIQLLNSIMDLLKKKQRIYVDSNELNIFNMFKNKICVHKCNAVSEFFNEKEEREWYI